jgi:protein arginine kinase activator
MKKCRRCTKPATLHITEIRNGMVQALHLCEQCAQEYLNTVDVAAPPEDVEQAAGEGESGEGNGDTTARDALTCPQCGITFKQFRSQGRLGCPHDYVAFREELVPLLESIHGETQHVGKVPHHAPDVSRRQFELLRVRNELKAAVQNEMYEDAARLRDEIQRIEQEMRREPSPQ